MDVKDPSEMLVNFCQIIHVILTARKAMLNLLRKQSSVSDAICTSFPLRKRSIPVLPYRRKS